MQAYHNHNNLPHTRNNVGTTISYARTPKMSIFTGKTGHHTQTQLRISNATMAVIAKVIDFTKIIIASANCL